MLIGAPPVEAQEALPRGGAHLDMLQAASSDIQWRGSNMVSSGVWKRWFA